MQQTHEILNHLIWILRIMYQPKVDVDKLNAVKVLERYFSSFESRGLKLIRCVMSSQELGVACCKEIQCGSRNLGRQIRQKDAFLVISWIEIVGFTAYIYVQTAARHPIQIVAIESKIRMAYKNGRFLTMRGREFRRGCINAFKYCQNFRMRQLKQSCKL